MSVMRYNIEQRRRCDLDNAESIAVVQGGKYFTQRAVRSEGAHSSSFSLSAQSILAGLSPEIIM
jgi:hypothetical protein